MCLMQKICVKIKKVAIKTLKIAQRVVLPSKSVDECALNSKATILFVLPLIKKQNFQIKKSYKKTYFKTTIFITIFSLQTLIDLNIKKTIQTHIL